MGRNKTNHKYINYLKSTEWEIKRQLVLSRENNKCQTCNSTSNLHIHHWTYVRIFKEELSDLYCLCSDCHSNLHKPYWTKDLLRVTKAFINWVEYIPKKLTKKERHIKKIKYRRGKELKQKVKFHQVKPKVKKRRFLPEDTINDTSFKWVVVLKKWKLWDPR